MILWLSVHRGGVGVSGEGWAPTPEYSPAHPKHTLLTPGSGHQNLYGSQGGGTHHTGMLSCYRPKRSFGQGNIFTPVCHSFGSRGGVPDQTPPGTRYTPWDQVPPQTTQTPPGPGTPPDHTHPPRTRYTPQDQVPPGPHPPRTRYPPDHTPPQDQVHPPGTRYTPLDQAPPQDQVPPWPPTPPRDQVPPRAATSGIQSTIGRYASYWNAFLLKCAYCCIDSICYRPQAKLRKGNVFTPVCQSFCSWRGVCPSPCWDTSPPPGQTPIPWVDTPLGRHQPGQTCFHPSRRLLLRTVRILLECILVTNNSYLTI